MWQVIKDYRLYQKRGETTMKKTGAKKEERFAKKAGKTWLDPMCTPFETRQIRTGNEANDS